MTSLATETLPRPIGLARWPVYYGWVNLGVAALAMVGTLPGRTQGLGPRHRAAAARPRARPRAVRGDQPGGDARGLAVLPGHRAAGRPGGQPRRAHGARGVAGRRRSLAMSARDRASLALLVLLTLTRGLGQSALSVASLAMVGKWFSRRLSAGMGVYAVVMTHRLHDRLPAVQAAAESKGWRAAWAGVGLALIAGLAPIAWLFARRTPEAVGLTIDGAPGRRHRVRGGRGIGRHAGHRPRGAAFWVFALAASVYGLAASRHRALQRVDPGRAAASTPACYRTTLVDHRARRASSATSRAGALAQRGSLRSLLGRVHAVPGRRARDAAPPARRVARVRERGRDGPRRGLPDGRVLRFWGQAYGRAQLGRIQGAAQILTVLASAVGPLMLARSSPGPAPTPPRSTRSTAVVIALAIAGAIVRLPPRIAAPLAS